MKTLKDKIIDEGKRILVSSIPFAIFTKRGTKIMNKDNENWGTKDYENRDKVGPPYTAKNKAYIALGISSAIVGCMGILIAGGFIYKAYKNKTLDYRKWPEIKEQTRQEQISQRNSYEKRILNKTYDFFDLNQNGSISKRELEEGIEKATKGTYYGSDFYDELNRGLKLDEKYIEFVRE